MLPIVFNKTAGPHGSGFVRLVGYTIVQSNPSHNSDININIIDININILHHMAVKTSKHPSTMKHRVCVGAFEVFISGAVFITKEKQETDLW
jgi:hypothetical protein